MGVFQFLAPLSQLSVNLTRLKGGSLSLLFFDMKKISVLVVLLFLFGSCKKDYLCTCVWVDSNAYLDSYTIPNSSKEDAESTCDNGDTDPSWQGGNNVNCSISKQ